MSWWWCCCPTWEETDCGGGSCSAAWEDDTHTGDWVMDLGAGGWTNLACDNCDGVAGEFNLSKVTPCGWQFHDPAWCVYHFGGMFPYDQDLPLWASLGVTLVTGDPIDGWRYTATALLGIGGWFSTATYQSATSYSEDCLDLLDGDGKLELTKVSESHFTEPFLGYPSDLCEGTLPATIEAWRELK